MAFPHLSNSPAEAEYALLLHAEDAAFLARWEWCRQKVQTTLANAANLTATWFPESERLALHGDHIEQLPRFSWTEDDRQPRSTIPLPPPPPYAARMLSMSLLDSRATLTLGLAWAAPRNPRDTLGGALRQFGLAHREEAVLRQLLATHEGALGQTRQRMQAEIDRTVKDARAELAAAQQRVTLLRDALGDGLLVVPKLDEDATP